MNPYTINISEIEELQTIKNIQALDQIFSKARSAIVNGAPVILVRGNKNKPGEKFDELSTEEDLAALRKRVYRYLDT